MCKGLEFPNEREREREIVAVHTVGMYAIS